VQPGKQGAPLHLVAEVAARLAENVGSEEAVAGVVAIIREGLPVARCRIWLRSRAGDQYRAVVAPGEPEPTASEVQEVDEWLAHPGNQPPMVAQPNRVRLVLMTDGGPLGMLDVSLDDAAGPDHHAALGILANTLSLWLVSTDLSRDLASEVAYRTREIEAHRVFTARIIDSLPVGLYVVDREYRIQAWNRKREAGTQGISRDDAMGRSVFDVLPRQPRHQLKKEFDTVFTTGEMEQWDVESTATGQLRFYRISKIPMRLGSDSVTHVITIGEDVTEWKTIQHQIAQTDKLSAVGQLAAGVMHEINNPLATIGACVEALTVRMPDLPPVDQQALDEYLGIIDSELERLKAIVDGLLDFSHPRVQARQAEQMNQIVEDALFLIKHHDRFRGITLVRDLADGLPQIHGNAKQLIQVFLALMLNAIDAMEGVGKLTVTTALNVERPDELLIEFSDTGFGIPREDLNKIFDPFFTTKVTGRGTGLGLSICYSIVQEHRGRILVQSQLGRGSTFRVYLPAIDDSASDSGPKTP
jgi:two-component system NtrC family sensor kinase